MSIVYDLPADAREGTASAAPAKRSQVVLLQTLVTIVLCYQVLFSEAVFLTLELQEVIILVLMGMIAVLMLLPERIVGAAWFYGVLALCDTAVISGIIYLSGHASSDLFLSYFMIMLIAAATKTLKQMIWFSLVLCAAYGGVLYLNYLQTGILLEGHLMRLPLLLVMAIFYGGTVETLRRLSREKSDLIDYIAERKRAEAEREKLILQLQQAMANIKTLRGLLPICSHCKKIRDDTGYWHTVETYVRQHSDADFSHGICPQCLGKLYPEYSPEQSKS